MAHSYGEPHAGLTEFPGYLLGEVLHRGSKSTVARAKRMRDGHPVVLKILTEAVPDRRRVAELRHERAVASRVPGDGVVHALGFEESRGRVALILEDFGGMSLKQHFGQSGKLTPEAFLEVAVQTAAALAGIHAQGIIHKDIKPQNILINPVTGVVKITDFSISSILASEAAVLASPSDLEGTLPYMAPEQTGRMNRGVDQRADLYSLGVTFYELLSGTRPFTHRDPLELVHAHIAVVPAPLREIEQGVPHALSAIVAKCLSKNPEDRYQSATGLHSDLIECRRQLRETGRIAEHFRPGAQDRSETLQLPQKLYGRNEEVRTLLRAFERAAAGATELLLVSGYAGVGKSALVNEVHKALTRSRGYFISGKFDQLGRSSPFAPIADAFHDLVRQILSEPPEALARWSKRVAEAVGPNARVLTDLIPDLELLLGGPQPPVQELGPAEAQNRFTLVFQDFFRVFAAREHPLVLFLDDLQWVDPASLRLLQHLLTDRGGTHLLVIGAYRDNEVPPTHALALAIEQIRKSGEGVSDIVVRPLERVHVEQLLGDALGGTEAQIGELAQYVAEKTHGNPFFIGQFLRTLRKEGLLTPNTRTGRWSWDLKAIEKARVTDNVVDFMAARLRQLPLETQQILKLAACIGHQFDLKTLSIVRSTSILQTAEALWEALREGFVLPLNADYRFLHGVAGGDEQPSSAFPFHVAYRFLHDRVQQAAYSLIEDVQRQEVHLRIGQIMLAKHDGTPPDDELFEVVRHLNIGAARIDDPARVAELDLIAGRRAKAATAFQAATDYLRTGMWLLERAAGGAEEVWNFAYDSAFALHIERAECEHLSGHFGQAEVLFDVISAHARSNQERAQVQNLKMVLCLTLGKYADAISAGRVGLKLFGIEVPETPEALHRAREAESVKIDEKLAGRRIAELIDAPALTDPAARTIVKLMTNLSPAAYFVSPPLFGLVGAMQVRLALEHGHNDLSAYGYVAHGMFLTGVLGRYRDAYEFGTLALALNERFENPELTCKLNVLFAAFMNFFGKPLRSGHEPLRRGYHAGMQTGDFVYLSYACDQILFVRLGAGDELSEVRAEIDKFLELMHRTKHALSIELQTVMRQLVVNLQGGTHGRHTLSDSQFDEAGYAVGLEAAGFRFAASWYYVAKLQLSYLHGDYTAALEMGLEAQRLIGSGGVYFTTEHKFYLALTRAALYPTSSDEARSEHLAELDRLSALLGTWTEHAPENFRHKHLLVQAEVARVTGRDVEALDFYDRAIEASHIGEFVHHEAIASELCGEFHLERGRRWAARRYLSDAYRCYLAWGATAKASDLAAKHRTLGIEWAASDEMPTALHDTVTTRASAPLSGNRGLDLTSVVKASHVLAREIELGPLVEKVLKIVVENAGAERGVLLLENDGRLDVVAEHSSHAGDTILRSEPLDESDAAARAIVFLVQRLGTPIVLQDAEHQGAFTQDPYVLRRRPRSVMCVPVLHQGKSIGSVYLENNLVTGAFTPERLDVLLMLTVGIGIAIANARLHAGLKESLDHVQALNASYRRFVPHEMLRLLGKQSIVDVRLGDHVQCEMSVLFADIRSFAALSESMSARETFEFVNAYLEAMGPIIRDHGGYIDKYIGDAIMALFPGRTDNALETAVAMQRLVRDLNGERSKTGLAPIEVRIGIHAGSVILGTVGEHERMEGTVVSDAVNQAVRLEGLCEPFGAGAIVSGQTLERAGDRARFAHRFLGRVKLRGRAGAVDAFEIFAFDPPEVAARKQATKDDFEKGAHCLAQDDAAGAIAHFREVLKSSPNDAAAHYLVRQAQETLRRTASDPVP